MTVSPLSPAAVPGTAFVRDRLVRLLTWLNRTAARDLADEELAAQSALSGLGDGWLGELLGRPDRDAVLAALPEWLTVADDSGLTVLVDVASGTAATADPPEAPPENHARDENHVGDEHHAPDQDHAPHGDGQTATATATAPTAPAATAVEAARARMRRLLPLLAGEVADQLAELWAYCPARAGADGPGARPARPAPHAAVADGPGGRVAITLADASGPDRGAAWIEPVAWTGPFLIEAREAAVALLNRFGGVEPGARPELPVGVWPDGLLPDPAVGLGHALDALAGFTGLPRPELPAFGVLTRERTLAPMTDADLTGRVEALALIGVAELLAPTASGWVRARPGGVREPVPGPPAPSRSTGPPPPSGARRGPDGSTPATTRNCSPWGGWSSRWRPGRATPWSSRSPTSARSSTARTPRAAKAARAARAGRAGGRDGWWPSSAAPCAAARARSPGCSPRTCADAAGRSRRSGPPGANCPTATR